MKTIAVIGTVDTKTAELELLQHLLQDRFHAPIIDVSSLMHDRRTNGVSRLDVLHAANADIDNWSRLRRDDMMRYMGDGAGKILLRMLEHENLAGAICIGGNQGTAIGAIAMRMLPLGFPKLIISTVASGNIRPYIEYQDIAMMFSVADFTDVINSISKAILRNGANAIAGMAEGYKPIRKADRPVIAMTAFGNTDPAVAVARRELERNGYEVVSFHASGAGGSALEHFIEAGFIDGVIDMTTHELVGEVLGHDIYTPLRPRLEEAPKQGIPLVFVPGCTEYYCFGGADTIPVQFRDRMTHYHNPYNTNVKLSLEEAEKVAEVTAEKLNNATGPVSVLIPLRGFSGIGKKGGTLYKPEVERRFLQVLKRELKSTIPVCELEMDINDPEFAKASVRALLELRMSRE